jgi:hypothetical protein
VVAEEALDNVALDPHDSRGEVAERGQPNPVINPRDLLCGERKTDAMYFATSVPLSWRTEMPQ